MTYFDTILRLDKLWAEAGERRDWFKLEKMREIAISFAKKLDALTREPNKRINGCQHTLERMIAWIDDGACPICAVATAGMLREQLTQRAASFGKCPKCGIERFSPTPECARRDGSVHPVASSQGGDKCD